MRLRAKLFQITVKTPVVAILLILLVFSSLLFIVFWGEINVYEKYDGEILNHNEELLFRTDFNTTFAKLPEGTTVIWYAPGNDRRYNGEIINLDREHNNVIIKNISNIKSYSDINTIEKVIIEVLVGKSKIYKRLFHTVT